MFIYLIYPRKLKTDFKNIQSENQSAKFPTNKKNHFVLESTLLSSQKFDASIISRRNKR